MSIERIHGGLAAAVIGDSMGTATETMTRRKITEIYGRLTDIVAPDKSPFSNGNPAGRFSDDSSQMLLLAERFAATGRIRIEDVVEQLLSWAEDEELFANTAGPTTREAIRRLRTGEAPHIVGRGDVFYGTGLSNGAAMKVAPAGWLNPGDIVAATRDAAIIATPTHCTQIAISGAAAVAAAVSEAAAGRDSVDDIIAAGIEGAERGERIGIEIGREAAGPSVAKRIAFGVEIARRYDDVWSCLDEISDIIGAGLPTVEAVPTAFALIAGARGDVRESITAAVNVGNDTDTVATIAGAIVGTMSGIGGVPHEWCKLVEDVNNLDLRTLATELNRVTKVGNKV